MQQEESLIRRAQQRDEVALTQLYEANFNRIYRYVALKIGDRTEAEDITQQVFLKALQAISSFKLKEGTPFSAWLFRIAHNQIVDYLRKKSRRPTVPLDETFSGGDDPEDAAVQKMDIEGLARATRELTRAQQEVISLRFAGELAIAEVAGIMGKSEGAIKALQHSAIVSLRKALAG